MFNIGDKIVYPNQGVGVIDVIEEKAFKDTMLQYYKIHLINSTMKLMLPSTRLEDSNIRLASDSSSLDNTLNNINDFISKNDSLDAKERIKLNTQKLQSGTLADYAEIISNLTSANKEHALNASEKQILTNAKKILIDEISLTKNITNLEATNLLDSSLELI
ncbi:MAG: CarD family transcriptional regulator [Clostridium sp.]